MFLQSFTNKRPLIVAAAVATLFSLISIHTFFGFNAVPLTPSSIKSKFAKPRPRWMIATVSNANHLQRRTIIRETWQKLFHNETMFDTRFVISDPGPLWQPLIKKENDTFGDLIMLSHLNETHHVANTIKTMEFFKHLVARNYHWDLISKMDEDSFIDARNFHQEWLRPILESGNTNGTYIGRPMQLHYPFQYASGQFYTLSWDLVKLLGQLHRDNFIDDEHEDVLVGRLMHEAGIPYNVTELPLRAAFDYYDDKTRGDGTAWAPQDQDVNILGHAMAPGALNPHLMKEEDDYLRVAACYSPSGLNLASYWKEEQFNR
jgi:hypothetical protein